jgi:hypothetical protein
MKTDKNPPPPQPTEKVIRVGKPPKEPAVAPKAPAQYEVVAFRTVTPVEPWGQWITASKAVLAADALGIFCSRSDLPDAPELVPWANVIQASMRLVRG